MNEHGPTQSLNEEGLHPSIGLRSALVLCAGPSRQCALERAGHLRWGTNGRAVVLTPESEAELSLPSRLRTQLSAGGGRLDVRTVPPGMDLMSAVEAARGMEPEVVIVPRQKRSLRQRLLGELPERLVRNRHFPVLLTQQEAPAPYEHVVVGVDFSESSRAALALAIRMLPIPPASFTLFHAYEPPLVVPAQPSWRAPREAVEVENEAVQRAQERMNEFAQPFLRYLPRPRIVLRAGDAHAELTDFASDCGTELVVVGRGARSTLDRGLGGTAEALMRSVECDVLVVPSARDTAP